MVCPNCGCTIKRFDLSQNCKNCGVNILYFTQEKDLAYDAKKTELEFAKARAVVARIKATYIGSGLVISRLVTGPLTVAALAIPFLKLAIMLPLISCDISTGAIGIYQMISSGIYAQLLNLYGSGVEGAVSNAMLVHLIFFLLTVLCELAMTLTFFLASINIRRGTKWLLILSGIAGVFNLGTIITSFIAKADCAGSETVAVSIGFGAFVLEALIIAFFIINILIYRKNPQIEISEIDQKRLDLLKQFKKGEISLDDLPLPVFETEEEKEKRENLFGIVAEANREED